MISGHYPQNGSNSATNHIVNDFATPVLGFRKRCAQILDPLGLFGDGSRKHFKLVWLTCLHLHKRLCDTTCGHRLRSTTYAGVYATRRKYKTVDLVYLDDC